MTVQYYNKEGVRTLTTPSSGSNDAMITLRVTINAENSYTTTTATYTALTPEAAK